VKTLIKQLPRVGDIAFVASSMGPTFYRIHRVHLNPAGEVTALTVSDPGRSNNSQAVAIERITAVFPNILNPE
jgi:hypothetical protein